MKQNLHCHQLIAYSCIIKYYAVAITLLQNYKTLLLFNLQNDVHQHNILVHILSTGALCKRHNRWQDGRYKYFRQTVYSIHTCPAPALLLFWFFKKSWHWKQNVGKTLGRRYEYSHIWLESLDILFIFGCCCAYNYTSCTVWICLQFMETIQ